ncbi:hypothetical protein [Streptomyces sp. NPDC005930]|uniref:hypothetical protein n=1 Tax=Streptomyces sp. NPDC005930 TaxID=3364736 RepID=UPI0036A4B17E
MRRLIPTGEAARPVAFAEASRPVPKPGEVLVRVEAFAPNRGPFDVVLESTGGPDLSLALSKVRPGGTPVWFGQASRTPVSLDFFPLLGGPEHVTIRHVHCAGAPYASDPAVPVGLVEQVRPHPDADRVRDRAQTAETLVDLRERRIRGKAVLLTGGAR